MSAGPGREPVSIRSTGTPWLTNYLKREKAGHTESKSNAPDVDWTMTTGPEK